MDIKINARYIIKTDEQNVILYEIVVAGENAKVPGTTSERVIGYYPNLEWAAKGCLRHSIDTLDLINVYEIVKAIKQAEQDITKAIDKAVSNGLKKLMA